MSRPRDEILQDALQLSESDRLVVANRLLETLPDGCPGLDADDEAFADEFERRSGDRDGAVPWERLRDELRNSVP